LTVNILYHRRDGYFTFSKTTTARCHFDKAALRFKQTIAKETPRYKLADTVKPAILPQV
jgi:hypothetical protein